jgi:hypothetical protein
MLVLCNQQSQVLVNNPNYERFKISLESLGTRMHTRMGMQRAPYEAEKG